MKFFVTISYNVSEISRVKMFSLRLSFPKELVCVAGRHARIAPNLSYR